MRACWQLGVSAVKDGTHEGHLLPIFSEILCTLPSTSRVAPRCSADERVPVNYRAPLFYTELIN